ncbi:MAG: hypothetical protein EBS93_08590 [Chitinophagia bacterium]|nr:hypothetical protein [Chitinophagia bacterium]NCA30759.1 hypothetical protein [Chitinophagia bacterium]
MHIYHFEKIDGLSELLSAKSSIVYASLLEQSINEISHSKARKENQALAGIEDTDLYYTQSILVTTSWNKNDDIFDAKEVWLARSTPMHKPTNLEHDEKTIVGHITSNWPIDIDGELMDESVPLDSLPEKFHILTGSVIYKGFTEPELRERALNLIEEIEAGEKYVSMECFFKNFDYGLVNKANGSYHILPRNEETSFLTKHLRAYGGQGEHENYKIGRVLRNITFSGKGFVNRPANPESIIFTKENLKQTSELINITKNSNEKNDDSTEEGVFSNQANLKETNMSVESTAPTSEVTTVSEPEVTTVVDTQEAEAAKKMQEEMSKKEEEMKKMKAALEAIQTELEATNEVLAGYKMKEEEMAKKEKKMKRMASLLEGGVSEELASATVDKLESLDDTTFESIAALVAAVKPPKKDEEEMKKDSKAEETTPEKEDVSLALENVETDDQEIDLSVGSESETEAQSTRAALVDFVCIRLGKKLNKGE